MVDQIVKSKSAAHNYNHASLSDIVKQGFELPTMETKCIDGVTFMGWLDDKGEWHQGAEVIVPELKACNAAQAMGAAISYARRYTALMALGLACDDDKKLENTSDSPEATGKVYGNRIDFKEVRGKISSITTMSELLGYWNSLNLSEAQKKVLMKDFSTRKAELGGIQNGVE